MKVVTVNVPESYLTAINKIIGFDGLYPSRSELIRSAVREFLVKELKMAKTLSSLNREPAQDFKTQPINDNLVRIPIEKRNERDEPVRGFKTYKIIKTLNDYKMPVVKADEMIKALVNEPKEKKRSLRRKNEDREKLKAKLIAEGV